MARAMTLMGVARVADLDETWLHSADRVVGDDLTPGAPDPERG
jgi:hypothetical protein